MEAVHSQEMSRLVSGLSHDEYLKEVGRVQMTEAIYSLIDTLDTQARQIDEHRSKAGDTERDAATRRDLNFAGSPYFDIARGLDKTR